MTHELNNAVVLNLNNITFSLTLTLTIDSYSYSYSYYDNTIYTVGPEGTIVHSYLAPELGGFAPAWPIWCPFSEVASINSWHMGDSGWEGVNDEGERYILSHYKGDKGESWELECSQGGMAITSSGDCITISRGCAVLGYYEAEDIHGSSSGEETLIYPYSTSVPEALEYTIPNGLCLGLEAEFCDYNDQTVKDTYTSFNGQAVFKEDSSCGIEMVTVPLLPEEILEFLSELNIEQLGVDSRCGVHIHLSRKYLSQSQLGGLVVFMNHPSNLQYLEGVAGRPCNNYCKQVPGKQTTISTDRYEMVNLTNSATVEIRIFAGTNRTMVLEGYVIWLLDLLKWLGTNPSSYIYTQFLTDTAT